MRSMKIFQSILLVLLSCSWDKSLSASIPPLSGGVKAPKLKKVALEGNIAAGKSTLLRLLEDEVGYIAVPEPISKWQSVSLESKTCGGNLLDLFYKDPHRWGYTFQTYAFLSRMMAQMAPASDHQNARHSRRALADNASSVIFFERSVFSDRYVFAENCAETGLFNPVEWGIYKDWHNWLIQAHEDSLRLDGIVYLRTRPSTCMQRLQARARQEEGSVPMDYLEQLHRRHESWLGGAAAEPAPNDHGCTPKSSREDLLPQVANTPVLVIECDADFESDARRRDEIKDRLRAWLQALGTQPPSQ